MLNKFGHVTEKCPKFLEKWRLRSLNWILAALPGAKPWKGLSPHERKYYMTRRAFLSSKSNTCAREIGSNMLVKIFGKWVTKMKIAQNLWIRLTSKQFPTSRKVTAIQEWCRCVRLCVLEKFLLKDRSGHDIQKWPKFSETWRLRSLNRISAALPGAKPWKGLSRHERTVVHDS